MNTAPEAGPAHATEVVLEPADNRRLANLCGQFDEHLRQLERRLGVEIDNQGNHFRVIGAAESARRTGDILRALYEATRETTLSPEEVHLHLSRAESEAPAASDGTLATADDSGEPPMEIALQTRRGRVKARGVNQARYVNNVLHHDLNFGIGPAGTGKTYLAVACAVDALERELVRRLVLVRPAVEAGERLGFLPGDLVQKVDPYLRPLYDALYEMLGFERVGKLIERGVIEIAPLAFMRGRTLNDAFIIMDEGQNTTIEQMKMFLTRIGFGSTAVVTGDITQVDLPRDKRSGLRHVIEVLRGTPGISFTFFNSRDVVRHPLVGRILDAYEAHEAPQPRRES